MGLLFLDISKAFDCIIYERLLQGWIQDFGKGGGGGGPGNC